MENANLITKLRSTARYVAPPARELLIAAAEELERLGAELVDERYRHDRYVDFKLAQSRELAQLREERRWIPVEERLPEAGKRVLASDGGFVGEFYISNRGQWRRCNVNDHSHLMALDILWWMPMPEPPKNGGNEK